MIEFVQKIINRYNKTSLLIRIIIGLVIGVLLGLFLPGPLAWISVIGKIFVNALKAIAPLLVFMMVIASISRGQTGFDKRFGFVIFEYILSTVLAALVAVLVSYLFPLTLQLSDEAINTAGAPESITEVLENLMLSTITNPIEAIITANFISVLFWAILFGILIKKIAGQGTKDVFYDLSEVLSRTVKWIINFAPFGILSLVFTAVAESGPDIFRQYGRLVLTLVGTMMVVALVLNPLLVFIILRKNPYPLVFRCLRESALTAFFTRSSAANIPVNMRLCERLGLDPDIYSVSIPLGSTINMDGAAVVITIMSLATANTLGIHVDVPTAIVLSLLSSLAACGTSGVAGGSILLIPMACALFGISPDLSMQVVGIGFIISVVQDSLETALNSSGDVLFTAVAEYRSWIKQGKSLPTFLGGETKVDI